MAGDWIKMDTDLPEKPEVWQIAGTLGLDPDAVVGKLFKVWRWFDKHTESGNAANVTYPLLDSLVGVTGFAEAMVFAGWLVQDGRNLVIPNFDRHNGKTAKNRALTAKRVAKSRNADVTLAPLAREEKRREENKDPPIVPKGDESADSGFDGLLAAYHAILPNCQRIAVMTDKRKRLFREAVKLAKRICRERGWDYGDDFWRDFFAECAKDPWRRGEVANPNNAAWRQSIDVLLRDDQFAKVMDSALGGVQ